MAPAQKDRESPRPRHPLPFAASVVFPFLFLAVLLAASCSGRIGWGVVLWPSDDGRVPSGAVTPVYLRSSIEKLYVVGIPGMQEKAELPLWRVEYFPTRAQARARVAEFGAFARSWLITLRDGLPVREDATNAGRRVYRLREGESVKILARIEGEAVTTGGEVLPGDWYLVLAGEGVRGYVFSNTMRLYEEGGADAPVAASAGSDEGGIDVIFSRAWRPGYFQEMIDDERLDLDLFNARFGLFTDAVRRQVRIELPAASGIFNYTSITEDGGWFLFEGTPLRIRVSGGPHIEADWSGRTAASVSAAEPAVLGSAPVPAAAVGAVAGTARGASAGVAPVAGQDPGADGSAVFLVLTQDIRDAIRAEELRRQKLLGLLLGLGSTWVYEAPSASTESPIPDSPAPAPPDPPHGDDPSPIALETSPEPAWVPTSPSRLFLSESRRFSWTGISALPWGFVPAELVPAEDGGAAGEVAVRLSLSPALAGQWEGVLSLRFDDLKGWTDLLWRRATGGLELLPVAPGSIAGQAAFAAAAQSPLFLSPAKR